MGFLKDEELSEDAPVNATGSVLRHATHNEKTETRQRFF